MTSCLPPRAGDGSGASRNAEWSEDLARAVIHRVVQRKLGMFAAFHDLGAEDLEADCLIDVRAAWPTYNPEKASPSTFLYMVASRRLFDKLRTRIRQREREAFVAVRDWSEARRSEDAGLVMGGDSEDHPAEQTLEQWIRGVYVFARRHPALDKCPRLRRGRRVYEPAQVVAAAMLMGRKNLSTRGAVEFFTARPTVAAEIGLEPVPSHWWFYRAREVITENFDLPAGSKPGKS